MQEIEHHAKTYSRHYYLGEQMNPVHVQSNLNKHIDYKAQDYKDGEMIRNEQCQRNRCNQKYDGEFFPSRLAGNQNHRQPD